MLLSMSEQIHCNNSLSIYIEVFSRLFSFIMTFNSFLNIDFNDLAGIMLNSTSNQPPTHDTDNTTTTTTIVHRSSLNDQQKPIATNIKHDRYYCLIIFNKPDWSRRLRKTPQQVSKTNCYIRPSKSKLIVCFTLLWIDPSRIQSKTNKAVITTVKGEKQDQSVDDLFIAQLRQLINEYMQRTKRPSPTRYFIDFSKQ